MAKENLTDKRLKALKPADLGKRYDIQDAIVPGLSIRVTDLGVKTFVLISRFPGSGNPTRRALGVYGAMTLEEARHKAREWLGLIKRGIDPKIQEIEMRAKEQLRRDRTFGAVAADYFAHISSGAKPLRKAVTIKQLVTREFIEDAVMDGAKRPGLKARPIDGITANDIRRVLRDAVSRGSPYVAHNLLSYVRALFNWARDSGQYDLENSPCDRLRPSAVIGDRALRTRILTELEIAALWRGSKRLGYPYGPLVRLLIITGQRKSEVAEASWSEIDLEKRLWIIPAERMKSDAPHVVPLSEMAVEILRGLPRYVGGASGDYLFSTTNGLKPVNGFSKAKERLDRTMLLIMRANARRNREPADKVTLPEFVFHDLRRTMRTGLSSLPVSGDVAELVIAHARPGLRKVYDQFAFTDEKRRALELWAAKLRGIVAPPETNVIELRVVA